MMMSVPPQRAHLSISMPNTRFRRRAQLIATCRGVGGLSGSAVVAATDRGDAPMPLPAGVTAAHSLLCGANTP